VLFLVCGLLDFLLHLVVVTFLLRPVHATLLAAGLLDFIVVAGGGVAAGLVRIRLGAKHVRHHALASSHPQVLGQGQGRLQDLRGDRCRSGSQVSGCRGILRHRRCRSGAGRLLPDFLGISVLFSVLLSPKTSVWCVCVSVFEKERKAES
jgi:hypothetical protein